jgi:threonine dehydrogenase-like Zn-dependent dehydrogenase
MSHTMKRIAITGVKQATILDVPIPQPTQDWVLVKVHAIPLCTEYKNWLTGNEYHGHEAAGEVVMVAQPGNVNVGDRVVVMAGTSCGKCPLCIAGDYMPLSTDV